MLRTHNHQLLSEIGKEYGEDLPTCPGTLVTHIYTGKAYKCAKALGVVIACDEYEQNNRDNRMMLVLWAVQPHPNAL